MSKDARVTWGADPEGFFQDGDRIIGSEKLIPKRGYGTKFGQITRDGVQFELHPHPGSISDVVHNVGGLLIAANRLASDDGYRINYQTLVEVSKEEFDSLSPECQELGCMPSYNVYGDFPLNVDTTAYRKRSAAGHLHIGLGNKEVLRFREKLVPLMDLFVGNTCVLLDRDPGAVERRQNYGRAGECRFPKHGVEYRTISNFWLRDPSLMAFVFGLAEIPVTVIADSALGKGELWDKLIDCANVDKVRKAIDTNDFDLALHNLNDLAPFLRELPKGRFVLDGERLGAFVNMSLTFQKHGIDKFFPVERLTARWRKLDKLDLLNWR